MHGRRDHRRRSPSNINLPSSSRDFVSALACRMGIGIGAQRGRDDVSHKDLAATQTKVTVASMASATNRGAFNRSLRSKRSTPWAMDEPSDCFCGGDSFGAGCCSGRYLLTRAPRPHGAWARPRAACLRPRRLMRTWGAGHGAWAMGAWGGILDRVGGVEHECTRC